MSIYHKYAPDGSSIVVLSYVDECLYWCTYEALVKWFVDTLGNRYHVNFLGYAHWFMPIRISHIKDYFIFWIRLDMLLLLLQNTWILPRLS